MTAVNLHQLVYLAEAFVSLGWSVQEQLGDAKDGDIYGLNPNAVKQIVEWLRAADRAGVAGAEELAVELEEEYGEHL
jgi:hypothetical protein